MTEQEIDKIVEDYQQILFDKEDVKQIIRDALSKQAGKGIGKELHIITGKTLPEWEVAFGNDDSLWDVSIDDIDTGAIEPNADYWYWLIGGRLYETNEHITDNKK